MCREIEKLVEEKSEIRYAEGQAEGEAKGRADTVLQFMRNTGKTFDEIAMILGYSEEQVNELRPMVNNLVTVKTIN